MNTEPQVYNNQHSSEEHQPPHVPEQCADFAYEHSHTCSPDTKTIVYCRSCHFFLYSFCGFQYCFYLCCVMVSFGLALANHNRRYGLRPCCLFLLPKSHNIVSCFRKIVRHFFHLRQWRQIAVRMFSEPFFGFCLALLAVGEISVIFRFLRVFLP